MDELKQLIIIQIVWQEINSGAIEFFGFVSGEKCELKMNNFPMTPLYTIKYKRKQMDSADALQIWNIR